MRSVRLAAIPGLFADDAALAHRARRARCRILFATGDISCILSVSEGQGPVVKTVSGPMESADLVFHADDEAWPGHWQAVPEPGLQDIFAMTRFRHLKIEGNFRPLMTHLQVMKDIIALPRRLA